jgi:hypothetical protein
MLRNMFPLPRSLGNSHELRYDHSDTHANLILNASQQTTASAFGFVEEDKDTLQYALKTLKKYDYHITEEDLLDKLGRDDPYKRELEVMAAVQAYFRVSYKACWLLDSFIFD